MSLHLQQSVGSPPNAVVSRVLTIETVHLNTWLGNDGKVNWFNPHTFDDRPQSWGVVKNYNKVIFVGVV